MRQNAWDQSRVRPESVFRRSVRPARSNECSSRCEAAKSQGISRFHAGLIRRRDRPKKRWMAVMRDAKRWCTGRTGVGRDPPLVMQCKRLTFLFRCYEPDNHVENMITLSILITLSMLPPSHKPHATCGNIVVSSTRPLATPGRVRVRGVLSNMRGECWGSSDSVSVVDSAAPDSHRGRSGQTVPVYEQWRSGLAGGMAKKEVACVAFAKGVRACAPTETSRLFFCAAPWAKDPAKL